MAIRERLDGLKLEGRAALHERVERVELAKTLERYLDWNFKLDAGTAPLQLPFVNLLVEEPAKFVVNLKDVPHHLIRNSPESMLI
jgi:hypothetical protein